MTQAAKRRGTRRTPPAPQALGELQFAVLDTVLEFPEGATPREILTSLNQGRRRPLAYTSVQTIATRMWQAGYLARSRDGRTYRYRSRWTREEHAAVIASSTVERLTRWLGDDGLDLLEREIRARRSGRSSPRSYLSG